MKALALFARHGTETYPDSLPRFRDMLERKLPRTDVDLVVVDNALPPSTVRTESVDAVVIGASNAAWEFSAWDAGVAYVGDRIDDFDLVILATSAFLQYDPQHIELLDEELVSLSIERGALLGHIDCFDEPVSICDFRYQSWIRSSLMFLPASTVKRLGSLVTFRDKTLFFSGDTRRPFRETAPLCEPYRRFVTGWLTGEGTGQGVQWHSRFDLTEEKLRFFEDKAMAIFNEQALTHRIEAAGSDMVDVTWLARRMRAGEVPRSMPSWQVQRGSRH